MSSQNDELVVSMGKLFHEFLSLSKLSWTEGFYRFVRYDDSHYSAQWSFLNGRDLKLAKVSEDLDEYMSTLESAMKTLFSDIEKESNKFPLVSVLSVKPDRSYSLKFDFDNTKALEINKIELGLENSYFINMDVDVPDSVKDFQRELKKRP